MTLTEIADRIHEHLKRFEADPVINRPESRSGLRPYYQTWARRGGRYVNVCYIGYQGGASLTREEAERYLAWLDAWNVGRHYEALREGD